MCIIIMCNIELINKICLYVLTNMSQTCLLYDTYTFRLIWDVSYKFHNNFCYIS